MNITKFRPRLDAMVATLRAHPQVEVLELLVAPPATEAAIRDAEAAVGKLPADILDFYRRHDGVFLEWGLKGRSYTRTAPFEFPDDNHPPGCINLLPISAAMSPSWEADHHVNKVQPDHQELLFGRPLDPQPRVRAVCVDNFARYNHADLVFGPEPVVVVSTDYGADMDSSDYTDFATYLDVTLAAFAANRYYHGIGIGWSRKPARVTDWQPKKSLDELLAQLAED